MDPGDLHQTADREGVSSSEGRTAADHIDRILPFIGVHKLLRKRARFLPRRRYHIVQYGQPFLHILVAGVTLRLVQELNGKLKQFHGISFQTAQLIAVAVRHHIFSGSCQCIVGIAQKRWISCKCDGIRPSFSADPKGLHCLRGSPQRAGHHDRMIVAADRRCVYKLVAGEKRCSHMLGFRLQKELCRPAGCP